MDWNLAIEKNREALKAILVMLVAMIGTAGGGSALPRHLHRMVLRLLRPAESAARRLIIVAARGLVVKLPPPRLRKPKTDPVPMLRRLGIAVTLAPGQTLPQAQIRSRPRTVSLPLLDPLKRFGVRRRKYAKPIAMPRIICFDSYTPPRQPDPVPPKPTRDDLLDASRLARRLEAIGRALDDLPKAARRMACWQARRDAVLAQRRELEAAGVQFADIRRAATGTPRKDRFRRLEPMRPGRPPGWRRKPDHDVYEVLNTVHGLAVWARERPDTS